MHRSEIGCHPGLTLIEVIVTVAIASILIGLLLGAVQSVRARAAQAACADHLRQLGLALQHHDAERGHLPTGVEPDGTPFAYLNWQARLLPYLEQSALWAEVEQAYRADPDFRRIPPHSARLRPVTVFGCPADGRVLDPTGLQAGLTSYLGVSGTASPARDGCLYLGSRVALRDIRDGTSNTLLAGERPPSSDLSVGWWYAGWGQKENGTALDAILGVREQNRPDRWWPAANDCAPGPYGFTAGRPTDVCAAFHFWSRHSGGAHFMFADGSVHFLRYGADPILPALATRAGGESVALND